MSARPSASEVAAEASWWGAVAFLPLLVLKLTATLTWSWWWITAPVWAPATTVLALLAVAVVEEKIRG